MNKSILFFLIFLQIGCYGFFKENEIDEVEKKYNIKKNSDIYPSHLSFKFKNFDERVLTLKVVLRKLILNDDKSSFYCSPIIFENTELIGKLNEINVPIQSDNYCFTLKLSYRTFRPFQRNDFASVDVEFSDKVNFNEKKVGIQNCKLNESKEFWRYECSQLDINSSNLEVIFTNLEPAKTEELKVAFVWLITFNLLTRTSTIPFAILPTFFYGYTVEKKNISVEFINK